MGDSYDRQQVEDAKLCSACGGRCCKLAPGRFSPHDLDRFGGCTAEVVNDLLDQGVAAITGALVNAMDSRLAPVLILAAQGIDRPAIDLFRENIRCGSLLSTGCPYTLDERPYECAAIVPSTVECKMPGTVHMEDLWVEHQEALREVVSRRTGHRWLEEFNAQLYDRTNNNAIIQRSRNLVDRLGMATDEADIQLIIELAKSLP